MNGHALLLKVIEHRGDKLTKEQRLIVQLLAAARHFDEKSSHEDPSDEEHYDTIDMAEEFVIKGFKEK